jgi:hypothetical protein
VIEPKAGGTIRSPKKKPVMGQDPITTIKNIIINRDRNCVKWKSGEPHHWIHIRCSGRIKHHVIRMMQKILEQIDEIEKQEKAMGQKPVTDYDQALQEYTTSQFVELNRR